RGEGPPWSPGYYIRAGAFMSSSPDRGVKGSPAPGRSMPAEWHPHEATWIAWPHNRNDWPGKFAPSPWVWAEIVRHLSRVAFVHILVNAAVLERRARSILRRVCDLKQVRFFRIQTDRVWMRDSGPIFLTNPEGEVALTDWHFNAWAKYDNWQHDDKVPARIN